jgi:hypothetical protein
MRFYHYTSAENYERIKVEGLTPYWIKKADLEAWFPEGLYGIWLWRDDLSDKEHVGSILWQLMTKASTGVVKLEVEGDESDLYQLYGLNITIEHDGRLGKWDYHDKVPAVVMTKPIPPSSIKVVGSYDLIERFRCPALVT